MAPAPRPSPFDFIAGSEPLALLRRIVGQRRPLVLTDDKDIESASSLVHAGHVKATMQVVPSPWGGFPQPGIVVHDITYLGWMTLAAAALNPTRVL